MEAKIYKTMMFFYIIIFSTINVRGQIISTGTDSNIVNIYPDYPIPTDSIYASYTYISTDGCPDYFLAKDSVVNNKLYVSLHPYPFLGRPCTTVITKFTTTINLGILPQNTNIYFNGKFIRTIVFQCIPNRKGVVVECGGQLYIKEITASTDTIVGTIGATTIATRLFCFNNSTITHLTDSISRAFKTGDKVLFGAELRQKDSISPGNCLISGVAKCYQLIYQPPVCVMDKIGVVVDCEGQLYIQEIAIATNTVVNNGAATYPLTKLYTFINNTTIDASGNILKTLRAGDRVKFGGILMKKDSTYMTGCPVVGLAKCFELIYIEPQCVMDRTGIVVTCGGQLYIEEITPYATPLTSSGTIASPVARYFSFTKNATLKVGDKVKFGAILFVTDSLSSTGCHTIGIAKCYALADTTSQCTFNRKGIVVPGIDGCTGKLFILEDISGLRFLVNNNFGIYSNGTYTKQLQAGDRVIFSGYLKNLKDSTMSILCPYDGVAICYIPIYPTTTYQLKGSATAGTEIMKTGYAILLKKGQRKAIASYAVTNGTFEFNAIPKNEYTVYVIPEKTDSTGFLPTFYINKIFYRNADYVMLLDSTTIIKVELRPFFRNIGTGRIHGNIYYESGSLYDNILAKNGWLYADNVEIFMLAVNIPVLLINHENTPAAWTMTDMYGNYVFENIAPDNYTVQAETGSATGESEVIMNAENVDITADFTLKSNESNTSIPKTLDPGIRIYPNPSTDKIIIILSENQQVSFYNMVGQLLKQSLYNAGSHELDISQFSKGVYFIKAGTDVIKLIKK